MNLERILPFLLYKFSSEAELIKAIDEISRKFTQERERISDYLNDPRLVSAYTAFYFTTNVPKLAEVFKWLPEDFLKDIRNLDLIDIGAGPGTFSIAFQEWSQNPQGQIFQIETSKLMREQALALWQGLYPDKKLQQTLNPKASVALFGHSANEMGAATALDYIKRTEVEHVIFIEPGTKSFFPEMLKIRSELIKQGFHLLFPCPNHHDCPMAHSTQDWCHQFIRLKQSSDVERLSQMAHKDRKLLPLIFHVYSKKKYGTNPSERIVRVKAETKFSFEWDVCHNNKLEKDQVMKRGMSKSELKTYAEVLSGDCIQTEKVKTVGDTERVLVSQINYKSLKP